MNIFDNAIYAAAAGGAPSNPFTSILPIIIIFAVFYFLILRPQQKQHKAQKQMLEALALGDEIVTNGGILGKITKMDEQFLGVKIADGVEIKVQRHHVARVLPKGSMKNA